MTPHLPPPMSAKYRRQTFQPSCPAGGEFYACDYGSRFVGCCASKPCVNGCDSSLLKPSSFQKEKYADIPGALCPGGSLWYKCAGTTPPFMGCCKTNPCAQNGCPSEDLKAATLVSNPQEGLPYSPIPNPSFAQTTGFLPVSTASLSTVSLSSSYIPSTTATSLPSKSRSPPRMRNIGGMIGCVISGVILVIFIGAVLFLKRRRKADKRPPSAFVHSGIVHSRSVDTSYGLMYILDFSDLAMTMVSPTLPLEADSRPLVTQIDGSTISELESPPTPVHEFPT